jgi:hypothetical protein
LRLACLAWVAQDGRHPMAAATGCGIRSGNGVSMVTADDVRRIAGALPRSVERLVQDRIKFNVGRYVYLSLSRDERSMGFAFPKEERAALVASEPEKFQMPARSDERYNWVRVSLEAIDERELRELVVDAWRLVGPKNVAAAWEESGSGR